MFWTLAVVEYSRSGSFCVALLSVCFGLKTADILTFFQLYTAVYSGRFTCSRSLITAEPPLPIVLLKLHKEVILRPSRFLNVILISFSQTTRHNVLLSSSKLKSVKSIRTVSSPKK